MTTRCNPALMRLCSQFCYNIECITRVQISVVKRATMIHTISMVFQPDKWVRLATPGPWLGGDQGCAYKRSTRPKNANTLASAKMPVYKYFAAGWGR